MKTIGLKKHILAPAAALLCIVLAGFLYGIQSFGYHELQIDFSEQLKSCQKKLKQHSEMDAKGLSMALELLCRDEKLQKIWQVRDRNALLEYVQPFYKDINGKFGITHLYFFEPDRTCFLRAHQPDHHDDVIKRKTLIQSQQTGGVESGFEIGTLGSLTLRVVKPWVIDGRVVGYLELGEEISHFAKEIADALDVEIAVLLDKSYLDRKGWENGMPLHDRSSNWDELPKEVVFDCPPGHITPKILSQVGERQTASGGYPELKIKGNPYLAGEIRLFDNKNRDVGRMVIFENIAELRTLLYSMMWKFTGYYILISAAILMSAYVYLLHIEKLLQDSHEIIASTKKEKEADRAKHLEEMLRFRQALEGATDIIAIIGLDRRLLFVNPAFEKLFGYTLEEVNAQGGTPSLYSNPQAGDKLFFKVSQGRSFSGELEMQAKNNRPLHVMFRASPILNHAKDMIGILAICNEIGKRKEAEQELLLQTKAILESNCDSVDSPACTEALSEEI